MATQKDFIVKNGLQVRNGNIVTSDGSLNLVDQISGDTGQITISNGQFGDSFMRIGIIGGGTANSHIRTDSTLEFHIGQSATSTTPSVSIDTSGNITSTGGITSTGNATFNSNQFKIQNASPTLTLKDTSDDDDHQILFRDNNDALLFAIQTQNADTGDALTFYSVADEIVHRVGSTNRLTVDGLGIGVTGIAIVDGGVGVNSTGVLHVRQSGDGAGSGIAITSSNATSHRIWKNASGVLNIGSSSNSDAFQQDLTGNVTIEGTITNSAFTIPNSIGSAGQVLKVPSTGTTLEWGADTGLITGITNFADNRILTASGSTTINGEADLTWNDVQLAFDSGGGSSGSLGAGGIVGSLSSDVILTSTNRLILGQGGYGRIYISGSDINVSGNLEIGGVQVINSARNLVNIGTISSGAITSTGTVYATEFDLPSGGMLDWANGDARIVEGLVNNYSLSFQTWDGSSVSTALRLDGNNTATFAGTISSGAITADNGVLATDLWSSNSQPSSNNAIFSGYGIIGNRGTFYITNGGGVVQIGNGAAHNNNPTATFTTSSVNLGASRVLQMNGTTVINNSRNLVNIGTISSGAITSTDISNFNRDLRSAGQIRATGWYGDTASTDYTGMALEIGVSGSAPHILAYNRNTQAYGAMVISSAGLTINPRGNDITIQGVVNLTSSGHYEINGTTVIDSSRNLTNIGTISSGAITTTGSTSDNTADTLIAKDSSNATLFRVRNDGVVLVSDNYLYVNSSQGAYFDGTVRARNGITDDTGQLSLNSSTGDITFNSANLTSVGTISSGAISTSGNLTLTQSSGLNTLYLDSSGGGNPVIYLEDSNRKWGVFVSSSNLHFKDENGQINALILSAGGNATFSNNVVVTGDLTVNGTTTTLNTQTLDVEDKNITLNYSTGDSSASANGAGLTIQDAVSVGNDATILWDSTNDQFDFSHTITLPDSQSMKFGDSGDLSIEHNSFGDSVIENNTGDLYITNKADDGDIIFRSDDGSGGFTSYFSLDGGNVQMIASQKLAFEDNVRATFGASSDLSIYHDGSNSYIDESGTGGLIIKSGGTMQFNSPTNEKMIRAVGNGTVELYYDNAKKFETTSGGVSVSGELDTTGNIAINKDVAKLTINNNTANTQASIDIKNTGLYARYILDNDDLFRIYNQTSGFDTFAVKSNGDLYMGSTKWFDLSRNLTNIGTISSGAITSSGKLTINTATDEAFTLNSTDDGPVYMSFERGASRHAYLGFGGSNDTFYIRNEESSGTMVFYSGNSLALTLDSSQIATFTSDVTTNGYLQHYGNLYSRNNLRVLNAAGNGWHLWAERSNGTFNLDVGTISSGAITVTNPTANAPVATFTGNYTANGDVALSEWQRSGGAVKANFAYVDSTTDMEFGTTTSHGLGIKTGNTRRLTITSAGNATFTGTISSGKIEGTTADANGHILKTDSSTASASDVALQIRNSSSDYNLKFQPRLPAGNMHGGVNTDDFGIFTANSKGISIGNNDKSLVVIHPTDGLEFWTNNARRFNIDTSGNIQVNGTTILDQSRNLTNIGTISSGAIASSSTIGNRSTNIGQQLEKGNSTYATLRFDADNWRVYAGGTGSIGTIAEFNEAGNVKINSGALQMGSTTVIDSSRNLTNIGTISSGDINTTSHITIGTISTTNTGSLFLAGSTANKKAELKCTNGNLHIDSETGNSIYLNYYEGAGIFFGNGATSYRALMNSSGHLNLASVGAPQTGYALSIGTVGVIDTSRNLTNIGTISSGAITSSAAITATNFNAVNNSGYGTLEVGGSSGAFIDLKKPSTDDYDVRIVTDAGTGGRVQSNGVFDIDAAGDITLDADGGDINLKDNGTSMASFTTSSATFAGTISSGAITSTGNSTFSGVIGVGGTATNSNYGVYLQNNKWYATQYSSSHDIVRMNANTTGGLDIYNQTDSGFANVRAGSYNIGSTTVIDASRNLTNIVGLSLSGAILGTSSNFDIRATGNLFYTYGNSSSVFFRTNDGATKLTIDNSGNATFAGSVTSSSGGFTATIGGIHVADGVTFGQPDHFLGDEGGQNDSETLLLRNGASASGNSGIKILAGYNDGGDTSGKIQLYTNGSTSSPKLEIDIDGNIKMGSTQIISSGRNLTNIGTIDSGAVSIANSTTAATLLTVGSSSQTNYALQNFQTDTLSGNTAYLIAYGSGNAQDGNFSMKNTNTGGNIFFQVGTAIPLTLTTTGSTFAGTITANHSKSSTANPILTLKNTSTTNEGRYLQFNDNAGVNIGQIGHVDQTESNIFIATFSTGLKFESYITYKAILPCNENGADSDNAIDLGSSSVRFDDIYATNGTIQTSDRNQKQDIQVLTDGEQRVATACKGLIRRFRWQDSVAEKDDNSDSDETARYHFGVIAQDLQDAFTAEGLDAGDYGMFISSTWTDDDGVEQTRLGVRYNELLSFIITTI